MPPNPFMLMQVNLPLTRNAAPDARDPERRHVAAAQYSPLAARVLMNGVEAILLRQLASSARLHDYVRLEEVYTHLQATRDPLCHSLVPRLSRGELLYFIGTNRERFVVSSRDHIALSNNHSPRELPDLCKIERMLLEAGTPLEIADIRQAECLWGETYFPAHYSDRDIADLLRRHPDRFVLLSDTTIDLSESTDVPHPAPLHSESLRPIVPRPTPSQAVTHTAPHPVASHPDAHVDRYATLDFDGPTSESHDDAAKDGITVDPRFATLELDAQGPDRMTRIYTRLTQSEAFRKAPVNERLYMVLVAMDATATFDEIARFSASQLGILPEALAVMLQDELFRDLSR